MTSKMIPEDDSDKAAYEKARDCIALFKEVTEETQKHINAHKLTAVEAQIATDMGQSVLMAGMIQSNLAIADALSEIATQLKDIQVYDGNEGWAVKVHTS